MARPTRIAITNGQQGWDSDVNDDFMLLFDRPLAIALHAGDETDLEATFAAASYDKCLIWVNHTVDGWKLYYSNGTVWAALATGGGGGGGPMTIEPVSGAGSVGAVENSLVVCSGTTYTVTLPAAATAGAGHRITIKRTASGDITIAADSAETIDGAATFVLDVLYMSVTLVSDGTSNWHLV